eukprot:GHUV01009615.1.p1 GENE.GHUV01009615.1~~GHUV01009615.1.p1  ORF type:complete len:265 (+),score=68.25 GHUV01009615.1:154-948(+)
MQAQQAASIGRSARWFPSRQTYRVLHEAHIPCTPAVHRKRRRRAGLQVQADARGVLDTVVPYGAVSLSLGATLYTVFYNRRSAAAKLPEKPAVAALPDDNFTWAVMGVVSCIPLFNFMAWVLGALQSDNPRPYYWAAALYALPLLRNGFDQDWFSISLLLLGAAHVQALRVAATEPETQVKLQQQLKPLAVLQTVVDSAGTAVSAATGIGGSSKQQQLQPGDDNSSIDGLLRDQVLDQENQEELLRQRELEEFDRRLNNRSRDR